MTKALAVLIFIGSGVSLLLFLSIDACLDAGGRWDHWGVACRDAGEQFIPLYLRPTPIVWGLVVTLSLLVGFKLRPRPRR